MEGLTTHVWSNVQTDRGFGSPKNNCPSAVRWSAGKRLVTEKVCNHTFVDLGVQTTGLKLSSQLDACFQDEVRAVTVLKRGRPTACWWSWIAWKAEVSQVAEQPEQRLGHASCCRETEPGLPTQPLSQFVNRQPKKQELGPHRAKAVSVSAVELQVAADVFILRDIGWEQLPLDHKYSYCMILCLW